MTLKQVQGNIFGDFCKSLNGYNNKFGGAMKLCNQNLVKGNEHSSWRLYMAQKIIEKLNSTDYSIDRLFIGGSTVRSTADAKSDIDLLIDFRGDEKQKDELLLLLEGWSLCLAEVNFQKTGIKIDGMLDVHFVDEKFVNSNGEKFLGSYLGKTKSDKLEAASL